MVPPELLYEIYQYLNKNDYLGMNKLEKKCPELKYLIRSSKGILEAKIIYNDGNAIHSLRQGAYYILKRNMKPNRDLLFTWACYEGNVKVVKRLLKKSRYYHIKESYLLLASQKGHNEVVKLFLENKRTKIDLSINDNILLEDACRYGYRDTVQLLLKDDRVDITMKCMLNAIWWEHVEVVRLLLNNCSIHFLGSIRALFLPEAKSMGNMDILKLLEKGVQDYQMIMPVIESTYQKAASLIYGV